jgi:glycerol-3-phosphate acyltransferase PlsY
MDAFMTGVSLTLAAYLAGSVSTAYLLTRVVKGIDIRTVGSRNAGAVNVFREVGGWVGAAVLAVDAFKGAAVILAVRVLELGVYAMFAGAMAVLIGHNWPVFLRFRGGKGVATIFGLSLAVLPLWTLLSAALALAFGLATRNVVFGIAGGVVAINVFTVSTGQGAAQIGLCLTMSAVVVATHFALAYREVFASVQAKGVWGLFDFE